MGLLQRIWVALTPLRMVILAVLAIGLPLFIYLAFIADEPVFEPALDVDLGRQSVAAIEEDPEQFPVLSEADHPEAYAHLKRIVAQILQSREIQYRDLFAYDQVKLINADVLNAFCTPGGFIYVYTGLINYLDAEDHLAGVLGHEVAHAEKRHSSLRLQKEFGVQRLLEFAVLSTPVRIGDVINAAILKQLLTLSYSRGQEAESDDLSVRYLADTSYACDGAAGFFEKLLAEGHDVNIPAFLSDHPGSDSRVREIRIAAETLGCSTELADGTRWRDFQASLPQSTPSAVEPGDD